MNTKLLKQRILDLAIHGRLVPQNPDDEPASQLLRRISEEKEKLIAQGKIKRPKKSDALNPAPECPFEIPNSWEWCKVEKFAYVASGSTPQKDAFVNDGIPYLKMYNVRNQKVDFEYKPQYITEEVHNGKLQRSRTEVGDLLMNIVGPPLGKLAIIPPSLPQCNFNQAAVLIRPYAFKDVLVKYLFYYLSEMSEINSISTKGTAGQENISLTQAQNMRVPLPPLAEQQRIVSAIEKWFSLIDEIETNKESLQTAIKQTKSKVLDLAIKGKLVKKTDEWKMVKLDTVCKLADGNKQQGTALKYLDVKFLRGKNDGEIITSGKFVPANSMMILVDGENSGEIFTSPIDGYQGSTFKLLDISEEISKPFLLYIIKSYQKQFRENKVGSAIPHLNKKMFKELEIPLPPLSEQTRIVSKIEEVFALLDEIERELA